MPIETRILDAIEGDFRCGWCGRFVKIGGGETLGYWTERNTFVLVCRRCEGDADYMDAIKDKKQERV